MRGWGDVTCIRCGEAPAVDDTHMCGRCKWTIRAEVANGFAQLQAYLKPWDEFAKWRLKNGVAA